MFSRRHNHSSRRNPRHSFVRSGYRNRIVAIESLERRRMLASTSFSNGTLKVVGDGSNETIIVGRSAAGLIKLNGANVKVDGQNLRVSQTQAIVVEGRGGNDTLTIRDANGPMPRATLRGEDGNDTLTTSAATGDRLNGGDGEDTLNSRGGNDLLFGGNDNDTLIWDAGGGNDVFGGGAGLDAIRVNGSGDVENFAVSATAGRASITRDLDNALLDTNDIETLGIASAGKGDTITVDDLIGSEVTIINLDLGAGDSALDAVVVNGNAASDVIQVAAAASTVQVTGLAAQINIANSEAANDRVTVNGLGGNDTLSGGVGLAALIQLTFDGGANNDTINGGNGADTLIGGDGNDTIDGNGGNDTAIMGNGNDTFVWDPGDGSDIVEGQAGTDTLLFNGSAGAEIFAASSNGGRLLFTRNVGNIVMDTDDVEILTLNALGGTDTITVNDLAATDITNVNIDLGVNGAGDAASDAVTINGTAGVDVMSLSGSAGSVAVNTASVVIALTNTEPANDTLTINTSSGDDLVSASGLANNSVSLTINGGAGNDILVGSQGNDTINGEADDDLMFGGAGNDTFTGGSGTDEATGGAGADVDGGGIETFNQ
jgi:Ca2+-binding RTX toxin-like protein